MTGEAQTRDAEPTWLQINEMIREGRFRRHEDIATIIEPAMKTAATVRAAQKAGKTITIHPDGSIEEETL